MLSSSLMLSWWMPWVLWVLFDRLLLSLQEMHEAAMQKTKVVIEAIQNLYRPQHTEDLHKYGYLPTYKYTQPEPRSNTPHCWRDTLAVGTLVLRYRHACACGHAYRSTYCLQAQERTSPQDIMNVHGFPSPRAYSASNVFEDTKQTEANRCHQSNACTDHVHQLCRALSRTRRNTAQHTLRQSTLMPSKTRR